MFRIDPVSKGLRHAREYGYVTCDDGLNGILRNTVKRYVIEKNNFKFVIVVYNGTALLISYYK